MTLFDTIQSAYDTFDTLEIAWLPDAPKDGCPRPVTCGAAGRATALQSLWGSSQRCTRTKSEEVCQFDWSWRRPSTLMVFDHFSWKQLFSIKINDLSKIDQKSINFGGLRQLNHKDRFAFFVMLPHNGQGSHSAWLHRRQRSGATADQQHSGPAFTIRLNVVAFPHPLWPPFRSA